AGLVRLVVSARSPEVLFYRDELEGPETTAVYTRHAPPGYRRRVGRIGPDDLPADFLPGAITYICGSSPFAEAATKLVVERGATADSIRVERFGPTG
ncbi:MAG TPA: hypothetical protein VMD59_11825, partial [Acidimicrobiales bacterium]|nr:hypothetical protein [Acidimicrobiales bacterium]